MTDISSSGATVSPPDTLGYDHVTIGVAAVVIKAGNNDRTSITLKSPIANVGNIYIGFDNTVTIEDGHLLEPGDAISFNDYVGSFWGISTDAVQTLTYIEVAR